MERIVRHPSFFLGQDTTEGCEKPFVVVVSTAAGRTVETIRFRSLESARSLLTEYNDGQPWVATEER
jgi:hypothetical protein